MMMFPSIFMVTVSFLFFGFADAQTSTSCNPTTNSSCPSDAALGKTIFVDFSSESSYFTAETGTTITYGSSGAEFSLESDGLAKTIVSTKYIFFGNIQLFLKSAPGTGVVSSFVMESDDLDEIDWEWLGGYNTEAETNYFGKGNTTSYNRATYPKVTTPEDVWHNYTIDWTKDHVEWYIDSELVRTLLYAEAVDGKNFPQTPMMIKIGVWDGGAADESEGTIEWAGGLTDLSNAPFTMYVKNITIEDYTTCGTTYSYGDESGSYTSIVVSDGDSTCTPSYGPGGSSSSSKSSSSSVSSSSKVSSTSASTIVSSSSAVASPTSSVSSGSDSRIHSSSNSTESVSGTTSSSASAASSTSTSTTSAASNAAPGFRGLGALVAFILFASLGSCCL